MCVCVCVCVCVCEVGVGVGGVCVCVGGCVGVGVREGRSQCVSERESMVKYSHQSRNCGCLTRSLMAIMCLWWHHCIVSKFMADQSMSAQSILGSLWVLSDCVANSKKAVLLGKAAHLNEN